MQLYKTAIKLEHANDLKRAFKLVSFVLNLSIIIIIALLIFVSQLFRDIFGSYALYLMVFLTFVIYTAYAYYRKISIYLVLAIITMANFGLAILSRYLNMPEIPAPFDLLMGPAMIFIVLMIYSYWSMKHRIALNGCKVEVYHDQISIGDQEIDLGKYNLLVHTSENMVWDKHSKTYLVKIMINWKKKLILPTFIRAILSSIASFLVIIYWLISRRQKMINVTLPLSKEQLKKLLTSLQSVDMNKSITVKAESISKELEEVIKNQKEGGDDSRKRLDVVIKKRMLAGL